MKPLLTILLPVYNAEPYLKKTMESLLAQTLSLFELLVINDGSTDATAKIVRSFQDHRIRLINHRKNKGIAPRLNEGLKLAQGRYVARADADDLYHPQRLEKQLLFMRQNRLGLSGTWAALIDTQGKVFSHDRRADDSTFLKWGLLFGNCLIHPSVMFKKSLIKKQGDYKSQALHVEDYELWSRLARITKIGILEEELCFLRIHSQSVSKIHSQQQITNAIKISQANIEALLGRTIGPLGYRILKRSNTGQPFSHPQRDIPLAVKLYAALYRQFRCQYSPQAKSLFFIRSDYAQKLLKILYLNRLSSRKIWLKIILEAYRADKKLLLKPVRQLFLILIFVVIPTFRNNFSPWLVWRLKRSILYRLHRFSKKLGFSFLRHNIYPPRK